MDDRRAYLSEPWGRYRPTGLRRALLRLSRAVPGLPILRQVAFLFRRAGRAGLIGPVDTRVWGHRLRLFPTGNLAEGRILFMPRQWDPTEREALARRLDEGAVFVDVGANVGGYVWWIRRILGESATILAVEPDPELCAQLRFNLQENDAGNVRLVQAATGAEEGTRQLHVDLRNRGRSTLLASDGPREVDTRTETVSVRPLADLIRDAGLERIDALKIDIEGLEPPVLTHFFETAGEALWPRILMTEIRDTREHRTLDERLRAAGYSDRVRTGRNVIWIRLSGDEA